jgi:hypothetical protein
MKTKFEVGDKVRKKGMPNSSAFTVTATKVFLDNQDKICTDYYHHNEIYFEEQLELVEEMPSFCAWRTKEGMVHFTVRNSYEFKNMEKFEQWSRAPEYDIEPREK